MQALGEFELLFQDRDQDVHADSNPDLGADGIVGGAVEGLDSQVLLDPLEEQLDLPAQFVEAGDGDGREGEVVGEEDQGFFGLSVEEANPAQPFRVVSEGLRPGQAPHLIAAHAELSGTGPRGAANKTEVLLGTDHEIGTGLVEGIEADIVQVPAVHQVKSAGLDQEGIQHIDVVAPSMGHLDDRGDGAPQVQQGVQLDRSFALAEQGPGKQAQAQVDRRRIEGIDCRLQVQAQFLVGIQAPGFPNQLPGQIGVDAPVPCFVGLRQSAAGHAALEPETVEDLASGVQASFDVAQALPVGQLGEGHGQELVPARESAHLAIPLVTLDTAPELLPVDSLHQLGKNRSSLVHARRLPIDSDHTEAGPRMPRKF